MERRGNKQDDYEYLPHHFSGDEVVVLSIFATHASSDEYKLWNSRKQPLCNGLYVKNPKKEQDQVLSYLLLQIHPLEQSLI